MIEGSAPRMGARAAGGPLLLTANLGETIFGGSLVPANVSAESFSFSGQSTDDGVSGKLKGNGVLISDTRADPVYQPLRADLSADLNNRRLTMTGPVRLAYGGITLADTRLAIDVVSLDGTASLRSRPLVFEQGGLQPVMLSERLRGFFTFATGRASGAADFTITRGRLSGTGRFAVGDFGFQTTRLGKVEGITGQIEFDNLLGLTTPPGQAFRVGRLNPGVPLEDGEIVFQLLGPRSARLQAASFPFAGGRLFVSPTDWTIGGDKQIVQVEADAIELPRMIEALSLPDIEATGSVSGRFPIELSGSNVFVRNAVLGADTTGRLSYTGGVTQEMLQGQSDGVRFAVEALRDFDFKVLRVGLDGNVADRMTVTVDLHGQNRQEIEGGAGILLPGQPFELDLELNSDLGQLIRTRGGFDPGNLGELVEIRSVEP